MTSMKERCGGKVGSIMLSDTKITMEEKEVTSVSRVMR